VSKASHQMVGATEGLTLKSCRLRHCVFCCVNVYVSN